MQYAREVNLVVERVRELQRKQRFATFVRAASAKLPEGTSLEQLLVDPLSRVKAYAAALRTIDDYTPAVHPEHEPLREIVAVVEQCATLVQVGQDDRSSIVHFRAVALGLPGFPAVRTPLPTWDDCDVRESASFADGTSVRACDGRISWVPAACSASAACCTAVMPCGCICATMWRLWPSPRSAASHSQLWTPWTIANWCLCARSSWTLPPLSHVRVAARSKPNKLPERVPAFNSSLCCHSRWDVRMLSRALCFVLSCRSLGCGPVDRLGAVLLREFGGL